MRNFLWSGGDSHVKKSLLDWKTACLPKSEGGLGLHAPFASSSLVGKQFHCPLCAPLGSKIFQSILSMASNFTPFRLLHMENINEEKSPSDPTKQHWQVSDGRRVSLWLDDSLGNSPLDNFITLHRIGSFVVVNSLIINGHWKVSADLPDPIFHILKALCGTPTLLNAPDKLLWCKNQSPVLTLMACDLARTRSSPYREQTFEASFWHLTSIQKLRNLL